MTFASVSLFGEPIVGEGAQKEFVALFGSILRLENILTAFDEFAGEAILSERESQDYRSLYLDVYAEFRRAKDAEREPIEDDLVFEIELVKQVEINVDYILMLVEKWRAEHADQMFPSSDLDGQIQRAVDASPSLRSKRDLIMTFVASVSATGEIDREWREFVAAQRERELDAIIDEERLEDVLTRDLVEAALRDGTLPVAGSALSRVLPPVSRFGPDDAYGETKSRVLSKLATFLERFSGLGNAAGGHGPTGDQAPT